MSDLEAYAVAYREARGRVRAVFARAAPDAVEQRAPAAPEWRVRDVLAHLSGVAADITTGNLDGVTTEPWTAAQVDARRDRTVDEMLDEWDERAAIVDELIPQFPEFTAGQLLVDTATHEQDIRGALGIPGGRDAAVISVSFPVMARFLGPGLRLETEESVVVTGTDAAAATATVRASRFDFFRAMTGRRSLGQMRAYEWSIEPRPADLVLGIFTARATPLVEEENETTHGT